jgi:Tfp pilus assembly protein PilW
MLSAAIKRVGARLRAEDGMTLSELLVAAALGLVVIGTAVVVFTAAVRSEPRVSGRANDVQQARTTIERITRELRQGSTVTTATPSQLTMITWVHKASCGGAAAQSSIQCRVSYTCTGSPVVCTRTETQTSGGGTPASAEVARGLSSAAIFTYSPSSADPEFVGVNMAFPADGGEDSITLADGAAPRGAGES